MLNNFRIDVTDLKRFDAELRSLGGEFERGLRPVLLAFARRLRPEVQRRYDARYPRVTGAGRGSIRAGAARDRASITIGSTRAPYMIGQEFGSNRYRQFAPWSGRGPLGKGSAGKFLYPTLREKVPELHEELMDGIMEIAQRAFPERIVR